MPVRVTLQVDSVAVPVVFALVLVGARAWPVRVLGPLEAEIPPLPELYSQRFPLLQPDGAAGICWALGFAVACAVVLCGVVPTGAATAAPAVLTPMVSAMAAVAAKTATSLVALFARCILVLRFFGCLLMLRWYPHASSLAISPFRRLGLGADDPPGPGKSVTLKPPLGVKIGTERARHVRFEFAVEAVRHRDEAGAVSAVDFGESGRDLRWPWWRGRPGHRMRRPPPPGSNTGNLSPACMRTIPTRH